MAKLDREEREILREVEADEWQSVPDKKQEMARYSEYEKATFRKDRAGADRDSSPSKPELGREQ